MLGKTTGARAIEHLMDFKCIDTAEAVDAHRAAETLYQVAMEQNPPEVEMSQELLTYPEGEDDAVIITEKDMEGLQPTGFLSNNIVDFYIRYLERRLSPEDRKRFYFFNSFFFTKLLGNSSAATDMNQRTEVDYEQVRRWTKEVNLSEKAYIIIPILRCSHWSLVIICHLSSLTSAPEGKRGSPCMIHLDPIKGQHESFEDQVRSYILEAWIERFGVPANRDQFIALGTMKYIQAEVPRQRNGHDCGIYLLSYIEAFLQESTSPEFSFASSGRGPHFTSPSFEEEVCAKRMHIQKLINELRRISEERIAKRLIIKNLVKELWQCSQKGLSYGNLVRDLSQPFKKLQACLQEEGPSERRIEDVLNSDPILFDAQCPENKQAVHVSRSENAAETQHQQCLTESEAAADRQTSSRFGLEDGPRDDAEIAHGESETTVESLSERQQRRKNAPSVMLSDPLIKGKRKRDRNWLEKETSEGIVGDVENDNPTILDGQGTESRRAIHLSTGENTADYQPQLLCLSETEGMEFQATYESGLDDEARDGAEIADAEDQTRGATVPDKQEQCEDVPCVGKIRRARNWTEKATVILLNCKVEGGRFLKEDQVATRWDVISREIGAKVGSMLSEDQCRLRYDTLLKAYKTLKKFYEKSGKTFCEITDEERRDLKLATTLREEWYRSIDEICGRGPQKAKSQKRAKLHASVSNDPNRLSPAEIWIRSMWQEQVVYRRYTSEWKCLRCGSSMPKAGNCARLITVGSLQPMLESFPVPNIRHCAQLRRLEIQGGKLLWELMDLKTLKFLEVLTLCNFSALRTIEGLSALHALTQLNLRGCESLRWVPELGCLKALTHLDLRESGVEEIPGVEELHLLTSLELSCCRSLVRLPFMGHLKALAHLDLSLSGVEDIPGVEDLVSLENLYCWGSQLRRLPNLQHLPRLKIVTGYTTLL